ncbi:hypothetical protein [Streptomyces sp. MK5]|uniref:hypothetical protein n=1 Tax=Streptomyces sp. MK5 TaxID=3064253 RepID=UPI002740FFFA|nr:hypothetical protein [Streptomyces sp. MK5]
MPGLGTDMTVLDGDPARRRTVAGYTRPGSDGAPVLTGAVALDSPRTLLGYRDLIGRPPGHRAGAAPGRLTPAMPHPASRRRHPYPGGCRRPRRPV